MKSAELAPRPPASVRRSRQELAFLPAALEVIETPPSPIGRAIVFTIVAVFCAALAWAYVSPIDIISSARGSIQPSGEVKIVQPVETGVVRAIHVRDGDAVKAGDVLVELDPTLDRADVQHIGGDLMAEQLAIARLQAALSRDGDPLALYAPPTGAPAEMVTVERQHLADQMAEQNERLATLDRQQSQKEADRQTASATIDRFTADLPALKQLLDVYQSLYDSGTGNKIQYLQTLETYTDQQHQLIEQQSGLKAADAAVAAIAESRKAAVAEFRNDLSQQLAEATAKAAGLKQDLVKAEQRAQLQLLRAPVDGVVQQLAVHTIGGVVTPAQPLLVVVPDGGQLQAKVLVPNGDIGFVRTGQPAEIKIDAFPYTRYGLLHGSVASLSADAVPMAKPADAHGGTPDSSDESSEPSGQQSLYSAQVSMDRTSLAIDGTPVDLRPGMAVTVEIKTGSRSVLSYLLSPLARYTHDSLRER